MPNNINYITSFKRCYVKAHGITAIVLEIGYGDPNSNPQQDSFIASLHANTLWKGMNPSVLLSAVNKLQGRLDSLVLG